MINILKYIQDSEPFRSIQYILQRIFAGIIDLVFVDLNPDWPDQNKAAVRNRVVHANNSLLNIFSRRCSFVFPSKTPALMNQYNYTANLIEPS